jgi:hypothetical protein
MVHFEDISNKDEFIILKNKATEIRKILFGALLLAKDIWKDELEKTQEGLEIIETIEKAEEAFVNSSLTYRFEKLENILNVIHTRANGIFMLLEYISKNKQKT